MKPKFLVVFLLLVTGSFWIVGCPGKTTTPTAPAPVTIYWSATPSFTPTQACFVGTSPTCTPTFTFTFTNSFTATNTPTNTLSPTFTYSPTNTFSPTYTLTSTPTNTGTLTPPVTNTATNSPTNTTTPTGTLATSTPTPTCNPHVTFSVPTNLTVQIGNAILGPGDPGDYECLGAVPVTIVFDHGGVPITYGGYFSIYGAFSQAVSSVYPGDSWTASFNYRGQVYSQTQTFSSCPIPYCDYGTCIYVDTSNSTSTFYTIPTCSGLLCGGGTTGTTTDPITIHAEGVGGDVVNVVFLDGDGEGMPNTLVGSNCGFDYYAGNNGSFQIQCPFTIGDIQLQLNSVVGEYVTIGQCGLGFTIDASDVELADANGNYAVWWEGDFNNYNSAACTINVCPSTPTPSPWEIDSGGPGTLDISSASNSGSLIGDSTMIDNEGDQNTFYVNYSGIADGDWSLIIYPQIPSSHSRRTSTVASVANPDTQGPTDLNVKAVSSEISIQLKKIHANQRAGNITLAQAKVARTKVFAVLKQQIRFFRQNHGRTFTDDQKNQLEQMLLQK